MVDLVLYVLSMKTARPANVPENLFPVQIQIEDSGLPTTYWPADAIYEAAIIAITTKLVFMDEQIFNKVCDPIPPSFKQALLKMPHVQIK